MVPINCPKCYGEYNACEDCHFEYEGRCGAYFPSAPIKEILTDREAIALLQDRSIKTIIRPMQTMILDKKALELQNRIVALEDKVRSISDKKRKSKYD